MISPEAILELENDAVLPAIGLAAADDGELVEVLALATTVMQSDAAVASVVLDGLTAASQERGRLDLAAESAYLNARATMLLGRLSEALEHIDLAAQLWTRDAQPVKAARTGLGRMNILDDLGRHGEAIGVGEQTVQQLAELGQAGGDPEMIWLQAAALENIGVANGYLGDHEAALAAYAQAEAVYKANGMEEEVARPQANRGVELVEMGRLDEAITTLRAAALAFDAQGDRLFEAKCLAYEARAQTLIGNYVDSAAAIERAAAFLSDQDTTTDYARVQLVRAETLASMNLLHQSLNLTDSLIDQFAAAGLEHDLAAAHLTRAIALTKLGQHFGAVSSFIEAEKRYQSVGDHAMAAVARLGRSELTDQTEAVGLAESALTTLRVSGRPADYAAAEIRLSQLANDSADAISHLDVAAAVLAQHDLPHLAWKERYERGRRLAEQRDLLGAQDAFEQSLAGLDEMRRTVDQDLQRLPFMGGRDRVHRQLAAVLLEQGETEAAYEISQAARARTLVERMRGELSGVAFEPKSELDELYSQLLAGTAGEAKTIQRSARKLESPVGSSQARRRSTAGSVNVAATVTYQLIGDEIMAFVDDSDGIRAIRELTTMSELATLMQRLDAQWRRFSDPGLAARQQSLLLAATTDLLQQFHLALVGPLDVLDLESLMIVPVGLVANVPFAALHDGTCHLIERMPLLMAPSRPAAEFAAGHSRGGTKRLLIGVADELTPNVIDEVNTIADIAPESTVLTDSEATVDAMWAQAAEHDIIHVASHAIERPDNPLFGAVRFADRWLTAAEVAGSTLDGQLVVLSSCSSGRQFGARHDDELIGLPRALLAAGASAVVVNLWQVEDASATSTMRRFHSNLETQPTAAALRGAQLAHMSINPHPFRWAPSVVIGAPKFRQELT